LRGQRACRSHFEDGSVSIPLPPYKVVP
jgi:hypothetical protein